MRIYTSLSATDRSNVEKVVKEAVVKEKMTNHTKMIKKVELREE